MFWGLLLNLFLDADLVKTMETYSNSGLKGLMKSLVQHLAQRRIRAGFSGHYPVGSWKPPRVETVQPLWAMCSSVWLSLWGRSVSLNPCACSLPSSLCLLYRVQLFPWWVPIGMGALQVSFPKAIPSPGWPVPVRPGQALQPHPPWWSLNWLQFDLPPVCWWFSFIGSQNWTQDSSCSLPSSTSPRKGE